jgi:hypothetical protein
MNTSLCCFVKNKIKNCAVTVSMPLFPVQG